MSNPTELPDRLDKIADDLDTEGLFHTSTELRELAALARRAQPEDESVPIPTTVNMARLMLGLSYGWLKEHAPEHVLNPQPEGEAPQAEPAMWVQYIDGVKTQNVARDDKEKATVESIHRTMAPGTKMTWRALYDQAPAATLSPLCGAQHAESGAVAWVYECRQPGDDKDNWAEFFSRNKPSDEPYIRNVRPLYAQLDGGQEGSDHA